MLDEPAAVETARQLVGLGGRSERARRRLQDVLAQGQSPASRTLLDELAR